MTDAARTPAPDALLASVIDAARAAGADGCEAVLAERRALSVGVRQGALEEVEREESVDLGVRVLIGRRHASVSGSDLSADGRRLLVERAVAMARLAPEDRWAQLPDRARLYRGGAPDLELFDPAERTAEQLEADARAAEAAALAVPGVSNSEGGGASWSAGAWRLATSDGFYGEHRGSVFSASASVIAGEAGGLERGGDGRSVRHLSDLPDPASLGVLAGQRAVARLGARKLSSRTATVIFENRLATSLLGPLVGAVAGPAIARGQSFLKDRLGQPVFSPAVTIVDDPHRPRGLGSGPFDDEGVATQALTLIDKGVLTSWVLNTVSAAQLGLHSTGHASRGLAGPAGVGVHNLTLLPGTRDLAGLMADAGEGLLVTSMFGPSLNGDTGDWSVGVSGVWFEGGAPAYPVTEITVAGNLKDIYARLVPGADLEIRGAANSPSLLVEGLAVAGK